MQNETQLEHGFNARIIIIIKTEIAKTFARVAPKDSRAIMGDRPHVQIVVLIQYNVPRRQVKYILWTTQVDLTINARNQMEN